MAGGRRLTPDNSRYVFAVTKRYKSSFPGAKINNLHGSFGNNRRVCSRYCGTNDVFSDVNTPSGVASANRSLV